MTKEKPFLPGIIGKRIFVIREKGVMLSTHPAEL
jgi:hypothetical protein